MYTDQQYIDAKDLLEKLVACPSLSREEQGTATIIEEFFAARNIGFQQSILFNYSKTCGSAVASDTEPVLACATNFYPVGN